MMIVTNNTIPIAMLDILKQCKGLTLDSVFCTDTGSDVQIMSMQIVVLRFDDFDVELWNEEQPDIPGELTDLAKIRIHVNINKDTKSPLGQKDGNGQFVPDDFISIEVKKTIDEIAIYNDKVKCFDAKKTEQFELVNTRAIVFSLGDRFLHVEKQCHWSEFWTVSIKETGIPADSSEWENEEDSFYEVQHYSQKL